MDILEFDPTHFHSSSESVCHYFLVNLIHFTSICSSGFPFFFFSFLGGGKGEHMQYIQETPPFPPQCLPPKPGLRGILFSKLFLLIMIGFASVTISGVL